MDLFGWKRTYPESIPLLEEQAKEICRLREEIERLRAGNEKLRAEHIHAELIQKENERLKERLSMFTTAKEKGCERGEYCRSCVYGVLVDYAHGQKCVCAYGECAHFRKDGEKREPT